MLIIVPTLAPRWRVCVVGAGVVGLATAWEIMETIPGAEVTVIADKFSPDTTSDGAGGFWMPHYLNASPQLEK